MTARLAEHGTPATGAVEVIKVRAWSCVLRVPTTAGGAYFKAPAPALAREVPLTEALARWQPDRVPILLGVEQTRGWLLMADAGQRLREFVRDPRYRSLYERGVAEYAELQMAVAPRAEEMVGMGAADRRLARMPALLADALGDEQALRIGQPNGLTAEEVSALRALLPVLEEKCETLAALGVPESLDHSDMHDANILVDGQRLRFFDWGDAGVAHPFLSLTVLLRSYAFQLGFDFERPLDAPDVRRLRDAYLEPWTRLAPRTELLDASGIAYWVGMLPRAFIWRDVLLAGEERLEPDDSDAMPAWMREWLRWQD